MKTKLNLIILCLVLFLAGGGSVVQAADMWEYPTSKPKAPFGGGDGSWKNPYRIETAQHLANLSYMVNEKGEDYKGKYFAMTNDINLSGQDTKLNWDGGNMAAKKWIPIGNDDDYFEGVFDGQGHTIQGMALWTEEDDEYEYYGLFGKIKGGIVKNVNMYDCGIKDEYERSDARYGILCGVAEESLFTNCKVSKSTIKVLKADEDIIVGGIIGDLISPKSRLLISDCKFEDGYILFNLDWHLFNYTFYVGGILGYTPKGTNIDIRNCYTSGKIDVTSTHHSLDDFYIGGIAGLLNGNGCISGCVSSMDHSVSYSDDLYSITISGIATSSGVTYTKCVYLGTISARSEYGFKARLYASGIANNKNTVKNCAFYGKFDINPWKGNVCRVAGIAYYNRVFNNGKDHNIVYSVGNTVIFEGRYYAGSYFSWYFDPACAICYDGDTDKEIQDCNYYFFGTSGGEAWVNENTADQDTYQKTLEDLKKPEFIKSLNDDAGANIWGKLTGMSDESLNGLPMPIVCGGVPTGYIGDGTSSNPYMINTEDDLIRLKDNVNDGESFENIYFKLGSDINMSGIMDYSIGFYKEKPFKGHLDGNGHAIVGLRNQLFGYMYGTVKNLAIIDCYIKSQEWTGAIAGAVGDENNKAEVSNCYVSGLVQASQSGIDSQILLGGICGYVYNGSAVHDCYFKGHLVAKSPFSSVSWATHFVGGISGYNGNGMVDTSKPQGIYNCYASFEYHKDFGYYMNFYAYGIGNNYVQDCYAITSSEINNTTGCTKLDSESELNGKFKDKSGWLQGVYRPLLASAKKYAATTPEETPTTVYFDAIPEVNPKKNYFYNISIDDPYSDVSLWSLPNMAVYVPNEQKDYITSGYIDQSSELKYKRSEGATGTLGQLHFSLVQNNKGAHFVCLPGEVLKSDLPEGSDAMIVGRINYVNDEEQVNVVHVDTIPAGVPCFLYVPVTAVKSGNNIDMLMRSGIVSEPLMNADYSSFKGTFSPQTVSEQACLDVAKETFKRAATRGAAQVEDAYYFIRGNEQAEVKPFSAWIESSLGNVRIVEYLLLDEYSQTNEELIENSTDDVNIKLRLTMDADKWTTVCLPFDMSGDEIKEKFGEDTKLEEVESVSYDGTTLNIKLKEATDGIINGYPYFIKPSASNSIFDLGPRILSNELSEDGYMAISTDATRELSLKMGGLYGMSVLSSTKDYGAYYFNDDTLIQIPSGNPLTLGGFRCWFKASDTTASAPAELSSVVITHSDGTLTDIQVVAKDSQEPKQTIYDLRGIEKKSEKGIYIKGGKLRMF